MKRVGNLIERIADKENLLEAFYKAQRGKQGKDEVCAYRASLWENIDELQQQIQTTDVHVGNYRTFTIHDPKTREIYATDFSERVLHHAIMNVCHPYFERHFIYDTYATRPDKGVYKALERARKACVRYDYVVKLDVRRYFDNISHAILKKQLGRIFKDERLMVIFGKIIDSHEVTPGKGLPIGNLTSQYLANFYLSGLDHYIKEVLRVPVYVRYMDDMLLFAETRQQLNGVLCAVQRYVCEQLQLELKSPIVFHTHQAVPFLGYRLCRHAVLLNNRSKRRFRQKINEYNKQLLTNRITQSEYAVGVVPLIAFTRHAYTRKFRKTIIGESRRALTA